MTAFSSLYGTRLDRELGSADSTQLFTTARRQAAINEAMGEFNELTNCLQRQSTITLTGGTREYNLHSTSVLPAGDFLRVTGEQVQVRYTDASSNVTVLAGDDLVRRDLAWLNRFEPGWHTDTVASSVMQLPRYYYLRPDGGALYLGFVPCPSTGSSATMEAVLPYLAQPTPLTSDSQEPFTVDGAARVDLKPFHQGLVHYAAFQLEKLRRDEQASAAQLQQFLGYVTRYLSGLRQRTIQMVSYSKDYFRSHGNTAAKDPRT